MRKIRKIKNPLKRIKRRYIRWNSSLNDLFSELNSLNYRYAVLRWFEALPDVEKGEDVDILIDNSQLQALRNRLSTGFTERMLGKRLIKLDIHGVYPPHKRVAYYPPHLAEKILGNAISHSSGARVPCPEDHFFSLAFHALYRKGLASGLPLNQSKTFEADNDNKYVKSLSALARQLGYDVALTLEDLDRFLGDHGWRPSLDYIEKAQPKDAWRDVLIENGYAALPRKPGLAVFLLREAVLTKNDAPDLIRSYLEAEGFNILAVKELSSGERENIASELRGGDWGTGPFKRSGGQPAIMIVALDVFPRKPTGKLARKQPDLENMLVGTCKSAIRKWWNSSQSEDEKCNIVHSSDNCRQAFDYVELAAPELADQVLRDADELLERTKLDYEVLEQFPHRGRRSVVERIRKDDGQIVVRKKFRPGREAYFQREIQSIKELKKIDPDVVPEILECGDNYFIMPYYKTKLTQKLRFPIPIPALRKVFLSEKKFFEHGYVMLDFRPQNLIISTRDNVKIIDYERMFNWPDQNFFKKYSFRDFVTGKIANFPFYKGNYSDDGNKYYRSWGRVTALPLDSILNDPPYLLYLKRWTVGYFVFAKSLAAKYRKIAKVGGDKLL